MYIDQPDIVTEMFQPSIEKIYASMNEKEQTVLMTM